MRDIRSDPVIVARAIVQAEIVREVIARKTIARSNSPHRDSSPRMVAMVLMLWALSLAVLISWFASAA